VPNVVLHVHDELVCEAPEDRAEEVAAQLARVMNTPPAWATGLPLESKIAVMDRYGKK
jgi:DNA polymerase